MPNEPFANPLEEASPLSLDHFFSRHPEELTDDDIKEMVSKLRGMREKFLEKEAKPKAPRGQKVTLSLDDILP